MVAGGLWGHLCGALVSRVLDMDERPWLNIATMTAVITGPLTFGVWAATGLFFYQRLLPIGVLVFPGTGIQENLADKARKLGIPVWKFGGA